MATTRIRDSVTGRFASRATYNRSVAQGGTRYKQEKVTTRREPTEEELEIAGDEWEEWDIDYEYP